MIAKFSKIIGITYWNKIFIDHMFEITHSSPSDYLLLSHHIGLKLIVGAHGQIIENMVKKMQKNLVNQIYIPWLGETMIK
jgi:hypothetical protein